MTTMNETCFIERVKKHFHYLESEYDLKISREENDEMLPQIDGVVEYSSHTTVIVIDSDRGSASLWFYRTKDGRKYYLDPVVIHEFMHTSEKEKDVLLSKNPQDQREASILSDQKSLFSQPGWRSNDNTTGDRLELKLAKFANWLKTHDRLCLKGDFSLWPKLNEYKIQRAQANELR